MSKTRDDFETWFSATFGRDPERSCEEDQTMWHGYDAGYEDAVTGLDDHIARLEKRISDAVCGFLEESPYGNSANTVVLGTLQSYINHFQKSMDEG